MKRTLIIAEAGVNHNGNIDLAKKLVEAAAESGVDYVKFQTFKAENLVTRSAAMAAYQQANVKDDNSQFAMLKKLELSDQDHIYLSRYCSECRVSFLSTPFDLDSIELLKGLGITLGKIPSGEITNLPFLRRMAESFSELILSTGMSTIDEVQEALDVLLSAGAKRENITVLHCNTEYPTPYSDVNLLAMQTLGKQFNIKYGYSDHTLGIEVPIAAVALGACVIEKHFTLDRSMDGPDHKSSLEPGELTAMVKSIRNIEESLGSADKQPSQSELKNKSIARKSIVAARQISAGEIFTSENITVKRPGSGLSPMRWDEVIGRMANRNFAEDELIDL